MHINHEQHEEFIRDAIKSMRIDEVVYVSENAYDGGYEVKVGTHSFFVDYEACEEKDADYIRERMKGYAA